MESLPSRFAEDVIPSGLGKALREADITIESIVPVKYLKETSPEKLQEALDEIGFKGTLPDEGVVFILYRKDDEKFLVQVAKKGEVSPKNLPGYEWPVSDRYVVKYVPKGYTPSKAKVVEADETPEVTIFEPIAKVTPKEAATHRFTTLTDEELLADYLNEQNIQFELQSEDVAYLKGKVVMVFSAGGAIGEEIVRQLINKGANQIILIDNSENSIYDVRRELRESYGVSEPQGVCFLADVRNKEKLQSIFDRYHPNIVFHYANYKSLVLGNVSPGEFADVNIGGTRNLLEVACSSPGIERFVYISSDKAESPSQSYGRTKRISELLIQATAIKYPKIKFGSMRYCNVLDSAGCFVISTFRDQIARNKPITVRRMENGEIPNRYYIPRHIAAKLAIITGDKCDRGEMFSLDKTVISPIGIDEMARAFARKLGIVDVDSWFEEKVKFVESERGEKKTEELGKGDHLPGTQLIKIPVGHPVDSVWLNESVDGLLKLANDVGEDEQVEKTLKDIVDTAERAKTETLDQFEDAVAGMIAESKMPIMICDLDGTVTESNLPISTENLNAVLEILKAGYPFAVLSGISYKRVRKQFLEPLLDNLIANFPESYEKMLEHLIVASDNGTQIYVFDPEQKDFQCEIAIGIKAKIGEKYNRVIEILNECIENLNLREILGSRMGWKFSDNEWEKFKPKSIDERKVNDKKQKDNVTQITFMVLSKGATHEEKQYFQGQGGEELRRIFAKYIDEAFRAEEIELEVKVFGLSLIDITLPSIDKGFGIGGVCDLLGPHFGISDSRKVTENVIFFGDSFAPKNNDEPVLKTNVTKVVNLGTFIEDVTKSRYFDENRHEGLKFFQLPNTGPEGFRLFTERFLRQIRHTEKLVLKAGVQTRVFRIIGPLKKSKAAYYLAEEEETGEKFVIGKLLSQKDEDYCSGIPKMTELLPEGCKGVYKPQLMSAGKNKWAGTEEARAVVYPYVEGVGFEDFFAKYRNKSLSAYSLKLFDIVAKIAATCAFLEERGIPGVWDIYSGNIIITPEEEPVLIDYTEKRTDPIHDLEYLIYSHLEEVRRSGIDGILPDLHFVKDPELNQEMIKGLNTLHENVKARKYSSIREFLGELEKIRDLLAGEKDEKIGYQRNLEDMQIDDDCTPVVVEGRGKYEKFKPVKLEAASTAKREHLSFKVIEGSIESVDRNRLRGRVSRALKYVPHILPADWTRNILITPDTLKIENGRRRMAEFKDGEIKLYPVVLEKRNVLADLFNSSPVEAEKFLEIIILEEIMHSLGIHEHKALLSRLPVECLHAYFNILNPSNRNSVSCPEDWYRPENLTVNKFLELVKTDDSITFPLTDTIAVLPTASQATQLFKIVEQAANMTVSEKNPYQIEADGVVAAIITLARRAKRDKQNLIIGLETDWIPGYQSGMLQHSAIDSLITELESLGDTLRSIGMNNVVVVHADADKLAGDILREADRTLTKLSNIVVLASSSTMSSEAFAPLRSTQGGKRAFLAGIDPKELKKFYDKNKETLDKQLCIQIMEMLSIALELAAGKEMPNLPIIDRKRSNRDCRIVTFIPDARTMPYRELQQRYALKGLALQAA